jgi:hypothetical protein
MPNLHFVLYHFSILLMEVQVVHRIMSVMLKGTSLLSFGMSQDMNDTKHVDPFSIHKSTVHAVSLLITNILLPMSCIFVSITV